MVGGIPPPDMMHCFPPQFFTFFPKITFSADSDPPLFFPISVNTALTKTLTCPRTLGGIP